jgi:pimeloyl-ACP methyl ester carboxylesterase
MKIMKRKLKMFFLFVVLLLVGLYLYNQYQFKQAKEDYPPRENFIDVDGTKLHYLSNGETGRAVVFLHGGILTGHDYEKVLDLIAEKGYQGIAFDRPGYGFSERPKGRITPSDQARLIHDALTKLGVEKPIIVAHSWSGTMALSYALTYSDDISGVITLGAAMYKEGYPAENGDPISTLITTPIIGDIMVNTLLKSPVGTFLAENMLKATFAPESVPQGYSKATKALLLRPSQFKANREDILAFPPSAKKVSKEYKNIKAPIVMVVGEDDPFGTIDQARRLKKDIPDARLLVKHNVAHMIPQKHPQLVLDTIEKIVEIESEF